MEIAARLEMARRNPNDAADWAGGYRLFEGEPMRLTPALRDLYRDTHPRIVVQKAAQVGVSEYLINQGFWAAATRQGGRGNVLYLMPTQVAMDDFVQGRVDRAIMLSPQLRALVRPVKGREKHPDRLRVKRVGDGYIYFRGAESRRQVMTIDADLVILDELDSMSDWVLTAALKRLGSSSLGWLRAVSTPTIPEAGINAFFLQSDQRHYFLPCSSCGLKQQLTWAGNVDRGRVLIVCRRCRAEMDLWARGEWVCAKPGNSDWHGYHLSKLYSPMASVRSMVDASESPATIEVQAFHRSDLGEVYIPPGGTLTIADLDVCRQDYLMPDGWNERTCMGVDVGVKLHVVIRERLGDQKVGRALYIGMVGDLEGVDRLISRYNVVSCVIDALPEHRLAIELQECHRHMVWRAYYDRRRGEHEEDRAENILHVNRTLALEEVMESFRGQELGLPKDARVVGGRVRGGVGEYYRQVTALQRVLEQDDDGNWSSRYTNNEKADHFAHAELCCLQAGRRFAEPRIRWL